MDTQKINLYLDEAFNYWLKLTGLTGAKKVWSFGDWHLRDQTKDIQETRRQDPTGLTSFMLMKSFVRQYLSAETFTAWDLLDGLSEEQQKRVDLLREVHTFLKQPQIELYVDDFLEDLLTTVAEYNIDHEDVESWLDDRYWMALLRRDALKAFEHLEVHQFCFGEEGTSTPSYGKQIWEFWNIPSLVRAMQAQGRMGFRGIHLCLIRDPEFVTSSFFVLAVVNGESLTVLTDRDKEPHPDFKRMVASRRPEKGLIRRSERHWFPYNLLDMELSPDQKSLFAKARTALVPINAQAVVLADFNKLGPPSAIWLTLLFDLIKGKYLENNPAHKQLSYTVEMMKVPHLLAGPQSALVKAGLYKPLILDAITHADVETDALNERQKWRHKLHKENQWMLDRYSAQVPADVFNLIGLQEKEELGASDLRLTLPEQKKGEVIVRGKLPSGHKNVSDYLARRPKQSLESGPREDSALVQGYRTLDPLSFGSAEDLERDRDWTARKNLCIAVQHLASREFQETSAKIFRKPLRVWDPKPSGWYVRKINKRVEELLRMGALGEWLFELPKRRGFSFYGETPGEGATEVVNLIDVGACKSWPGYGYGYGGIGYYALHLGEYAGDGQRYCPFTGAVATYHAHIQPRDGKSLAMILGLKFKQLPWQLQVWQHKPWDVDHGNPILDRCDPAEWALHSPWVGNKRSTARSEWCFPLSIGVSLSRRAVNRIRKEHGVPKPDWKDLEDTEKGR